MHIPLPKKENDAQNINPATVGTFHTKLAVHAPLHFMSQQRNQQHLEYFFLRAIGPEDPVKQKIDFSVVLRRPLRGRILDADLLRVVGEVGDERAASGVRSRRLGARRAFWRQSCHDVMRQNCTEQEPITTTLVLLSAAS